MAISWKKVMAGLVATLMPTSEEDLTIIFEKITRV